MNRGQLTRPGRRSPASAAALAVVLTAAFTAAGAAAAGGGRLELIEGPRSATATEAGQPFELKIEVPAAPAIEDRPLLVVDWTGAGGRPTLVELHWDRTEMDTYGRGHVRVRAPAAEAGAPRRLLVDLRRTPFAGFGGLTRLELVFHRTSAGGAAPEPPIVTGAALMRPSWALLAAERWQRLRAPCPNQLPLVLAALILIGGGGLALAAGLARLAGRRIPALRLWLGFVLALWAADGLQAARGYGLERGALIRAVGGLRPEEQRRRAMGASHDLIAAARELIPPEATVGTSSSRLVPDDFRYFAGYELAPRPVVLGPNGDFHLADQAAPLTPEAIAAAREQGWHFVAAIDSRHYIFGRRPPAPADLGRPLAAAEWKLAAADLPGGAGLAADGDLASRWTANHVQRPGDAIEIDLGRPAQLAGVRVWHHGFWDDWPRGLRVSISAEGRSWRPVAEQPVVGASRTAPPALARGYFEAAFGVAPARYVRIEQTGEHPFFYWTVSEIELFEPAAGAEQAAGPAP